MAGHQWLDSAAYDNMRAVSAADQTIREAANAGYYVALGGAISAGTTGTVTLAATTDFFGTTELVLTAAMITAATNQAFIASLSAGNATNPMWVLLEVDSSGVLQLNQGTPAATPLVPTPTASRVVHYLVYCPAACTDIDALLTTANGKAKLIDMREIVAVHPSRLFASDVSQTVLTNPTSLTTLLASAPSVPANSLTIGDTFTIDASGTWVNTSTNSTMLFSLLIGAVTLFTLTTNSLNLDASNARRWTFHSVLTVKTLGSGTSATLLHASSFFISKPSATAGALLTVGGGANGDAGVGASIGSGGFNSTIANVLDIQAAFGTSSATQTINQRQFSVIKTPA